jgi:hypothetical protein
MPNALKRSTSGTPPVSGLRALAAIVLGAVLPIAAATALNPAVTHLCRPVPDSFKIDGVLDEPQWKGLDTLRLMLNNAPAGGKPSVETKVLTAWSQTCLYVGYIIDTHDVKGDITAHDGPLYNQDVAEMFFDPDSDSKNYLELEWNCLNTVFDQSMSSPRNGANLGWSPAGMENAVKVHGTANKSSDTDSGWTLEISIPWSALQPFSQIQSAFPPKAGDKLPINFYRIDHASGKEELISWSPTGAADFHLPDKFGSLIFSAQPVTSLLPRLQARLRAPAMPFLRADGRSVSGSGGKFWLFQVPARATREREARDRETPAR